MMDLKKSTDMDAPAQKEMVPLTPEALGLDQAAPDADAVAVATAPENPL